MTEPQFQRAHPATFFVVLAGIARKYLIPGLIVLFVGSRWRGESLIIWFAIPAALYSLYQFFFLKLAITDEQLIIKEGLLGRSLRRIPFSKIQSIETQRNLIHQLFNIDDIFIHTGAGQEAEAALSAFSHDVTLRLKQRHKQGQCSQEEPETAPSLTWKTEPHHLIGYGFAFNHGMVILALVFGAAWQLDLIDGLTDLFRMIYHDLEGNGPMFVGLIAITIAASWLLLRLCSVLWALIMFHGFTFEKERDHFHLSFGSIFHRNMSLPGKRFHVISVEEKVWHRKLACTTISARTAGTWAGDHDDDDEEEKKLMNKLILHPFADAKETNALIEELTGDRYWKEQDWQRLDPSAFKREIKPNLLIAISIGALVTSIFKLWSLLFWPFILAGAFYHTWVVIKHTGYAMTDHGFWLCTGYLNKQWRFVSFGHMQTVSLVESFFDMRKDAARIMIDAPSAIFSEQAIEVPYLPKPQAEAVYQQLQKQTLAHESLF